MITVPIKTGHVHLTTLPPPRPEESEGQYTSRLLRELEVFFEDPVDGTRVDCAFLDEVRTAFNSRS